MTIMELLHKRLQPKYVGWQDQYRAILWAMSVPDDTPADEVLDALKKFRD